MKKGRRIKTLRQLQDAALTRRSVVCPWSPCWDKPRPAAFVINLQGHVLVRMLERGMYLYVANDRTQGSERSGDTSQ